MKINILKSALAMCLFSQVAYAASWQGLTGKFQAEGQQGCAEHIKINFQMIFNRPQIFGYDLNRPVGKNQIFVFVEGEYATGYGDLTNYYYSYEINNGQGHYFSNIQSNSTNQIISHTRLSVAVESEEVIESFYFYKDDYISKASDYCVYQRED